MHTYILILVRTMLLPGVRIVRVDSFSVKASWRWRTMETYEKYWCIKSTLLL